jgi:HAD superfamily hydrolase (TIGR01509 family)
MRRDLRGLLLDFDGTIADTERHGHRVAYNQAFAEYGLNWTWDDDLYKDLLAVAGGKERMQHYIAHYRPALPLGIPAARLIQELHLAKSRHFGALAPVIPLRPGILRLLREVHAAGISIALATTAMKPGVDAFLGHHPELAAVIGVIAAGDVVEHKKPAPDIYLWALREMGLSPRQCVAIEDSSVGLSAALAAGLPTLVTISEYTAGNDFSGAAAVLSSLGDPADPVEVSAGTKPPAGGVDLNYLRSL